METKTKPKVKIATKAKKVIVQVAWNREASDYMEEYGFEELKKFVKKNPESGFSYDEKKFNTKAEAVSYMKGIGDGNGWDSPNYQIAK